MGIRKTASTAILKIETSHFGTKCKYCYALQYRFGAVLANSEMVNRLQKSLPGVNLARPSMDSCCFLCLQKDPKKTPESLRSPLLYRTRCTNL